MRKKQKATVSRACRRILSSASFARIVVSMVLLASALIPLYKIFAETHEVNKQISIDLNADCLKKFSVEQNIFIDAAGDARITMKIDSLQALFSCKYFVVSIPGTITLAAPQKAVATFFEGRVAFKLEKIDPDISTERFIYVDGKIPHILTSKTFSRRTLNIEVMARTLGEITLMPGESPDQIPWDITTNVILAPVFDISESAFARHSVGLDEHNQIRISSTASTNYDSILLFLENGESASKRDLQILYSGAMIGTASAILADLVVGLLYRKKRLV